MIGDLCTKRLGTFRETGKSNMAVVLCRKCLRKIPGLYAASSKTGYVFRHFRLVYMCLMYIRVVCRIF